MVKCYHITTRNHQKNIGSKRKISKKKSRKNEKQKTKNRKRKTEKPDCRHEDKGGKRDEYVESGKSD